jgi:hypothetical protein
VTCARVSSTPVSKWIAVPRRTSNAARLYFAGAGLALWVLAKCWTASSWLTVADGIGRGRGVDVVGTADVGAVANLCLREGGICPPSGAAKSLERTGATAAAAAVGATALTVTGGPVMIIVADTEPVGLAGGLPAWDVVGVGVVLL